MVSTRRLKHSQGYVSFHNIGDKEINQIMILQTHLINNLREKFGGEVFQKRSYRTLELQGSK
jgi:hypothetical protein